MPKSLSLGSNEICHLQEIKTWSNDPAVLTMARSRFSRTLGPPPVRTSL